MPLPTLELALPVACPLPRARTDSAIPRASDMSPASLKAVGSSVPSSRRKP
jgi:hypothetical protein